MGELFYVSGDRDSLYLLSPRVQIPPKDGDIIQSPERRAFKLNIGTISNILNVDTYISIPSSQICKANYNNFSRRC